MSGDTFGCRPLDAKTMQYCANDVIHLPALRDVYTKKIDSQWMQKIKDESARRVVEACGPAYQPQSEAKKLGPWGSASGQKVLTLDEALEILEEERMEALAEDMFNHDLDDFWDDAWDDDYPINTKDETRGDDAFDSCWEK